MEARDDALFGAGVIGSRKFPVWRVGMMQPLLTILATRGEEQVLGVASGVPVLCEHFEGIGR